VDTQGLNILCPPCDESQGVFAKLPVEELPLHQGVCKGWQAFIQAKFGVQIAEIAKELSIIDGMPKNLIEALGGRLNVYRLPQVDASHMALGNMCYEMNLMVQQGNIRTAQQLQSLPKLEFDYFENKIGQNGLSNVLSESISRGVDKQNRHFIAFKLVCEDAFGNIKISAETLLECGGIWIGASQSFAPYLYSEFSAVPKIDESSCQKIANLCKGMSIGGSSLVIDIFGRPQLEQNTNVKLWTKEPM
jgi:hypothetical protein